jgi:hypothetical protein
MCHLTYATLADEDDPRPGTDVPVIFCRAMVSLIGSPDRIHLDRFAGGMLSAPF